MGNTIRFSVRNVPMGRRRQTFAVLAYCILLPGACTALALFCLFSPFTWPVFIPYLIWMYAIDKRPFNGKSGPSHWWKSIRLVRVF